MNKYIKQISDRIFKNVLIAEFSNKAILITGANGLIGGFIADFLHYLNVEHDYNIKIILTSLSKNPKRLKHLLDNDNVLYLPIDLADEKDLNLDSELIKNQSKNLKWGEDGLDVEEIDTYNLNNR